MVIILLKLLITPFFIGAATLAGRRWGPIVNGLVVGSAPDHRADFVHSCQRICLAFATKAAAGNLAGQVSMWPYSA